MLLCFRPLDASESIHGGTSTLRGRGCRDCGRTPARGGSGVEQRTEEDHSCPNAKLRVPAVPEPPHAEAEADCFARCQDEVGRHGGDMLLNFSDEKLAKSWGHRGRTELS